MEATSDVVLEQSMTCVSTKRVQEMSATSIQQLSSTASSEKSVSISNIGNVGTGSVLSITDTVGIEGPVSSIICSAPKGVNNSSLEIELTAMKLTNDSGVEIGEMVRQKQQQETVMSSVNTVDGNSLSSLSMQQQASTSTVVSESSSTSSSVSCTSYSSTKKQEIVSSTATSKQISSSSKSSLKYSQSAEKHLKSSVDTIEYVVEDEEF